MYKLPSACCYNRPAPMKTGDDLKVCAVSAVPLPYAPPSHLTQAARVAGLTLTEERVALVETRSVVLTRTRLAFVHILLAPLACRQRHVSIHRSAAPKRDNFAQTVIFDVF